ncbi:MAG: hypothetical protein A2Y71_06205 [Bacteroidetes bacterium RBG_13_42_15]|nr:MAG: hypothetical protein A2Y71_06205 [Bacteroidetes bacterium RBG_13_42_15]
MNRNKRYWWLVSVINHRRYRRGAEIGCAKGATTWRVLSYCPCLRTLFAVDLWAPVPPEAGGGSRYKDWDFPSVRKRFDELTRSYFSRLVVVKGVSWLMAEKIKNRSLDFVFIDADHEYESVVKDIQAWTPKLKSNGMISGHDCNFPGVLQAINELIPDWHEVGIDNVWEAKKENVRL